MTTMSICYAFIVSAKFGACVPIMGLFSLASTSSQTPYKCYNYPVYVTIRPCPTFRKVSYATD